MKAGDVVTVYQDPISRTQPEGEARLVRCIDKGADPAAPQRLERWKVRFVGDRETFVRTIMVGCFLLALAGCTDPVEPEPLRCGQVVAIAPNGDTLGVVGELCMSGPVVVRP